MPSSLASKTTNINQGSSKQLHTDTECSGSLGISIHPGSPLGLELGLELNSEWPRCVAVRTLGHHEAGLDGAGGQAEQRGWSYTWRAFIINLGFPIHGSGVVGWEKQANPSVAPAVTAPSPGIEHHSPPGPPKVWKQGLSLTYPYLHGPPNPEHLPAQYTLESQRMSR